jgi:hypothetical protein
VIAVYGDGALALERAANVGERAIGTPRVELSTPLLGEQIQRRRGRGAQKSSMIWS